MYGSVEVYLEDGQITQITQRIIKKIKKIKPQTKTISKTNRPGMKNEEITLKFQN
jgi:hypothetical protein